MNNFSSSPTFDNQDEYPKVTQADMDRATFRVGLTPTPHKQRTTILIDKELSRDIDKFAQLEGILPETLVNLWLKEKILEKQSRKRGQV
ncbi:MAG: hypothetical protein LGR52_12100 [Candidatus Thiosymbion ectosymbiont of Robbea hypermnestra]|nr:hypothetical protein [Candidatus Thiosymbion ectosymbiont of Robbea hypermnestra]